MPNHTQPTKCSVCCSPVLLHTSPEKTSYYTPILSAVKLADIREAIGQAADEIFENAESLKQCSTNSEGEWGEELDAEESYNQSIALVNRLRRFL